MTRIPLPRLRGLAPGSAGRRRPLRFAPREYLAAGWVIRTEPEYGYVWAYRGEPGKPTPSLVRGSLPGSYMRTPGRMEPKEVRLFAVRVMREIIELGCDACDVRDMFAAPSAVLAK